MILHGRAWRRYGTILVDLETHRLLALLANCEGETVATWFRQHPSVQFVTRDRSLNFAEAIRLGAPQSLQIADRFHLHMNAMTCLETLLGREQTTIRQVVATLCAEHRQAHPTPPAIRRWRLNGNRMSDGLVDTPAVSRSSSGRAQGWSKPGDCAGNGTASADGRHLSASAGPFPERAPHPSRGRVIEPYLEYLRQRWEQGEHNGRLLFEEIRAQGYPAGLTEVYVAIQPWRTHGPTASLARAKEVQQYPSYSPKQTLWLLFKEKPTAEEQQFVQSLLEQSALIAHTYAFVRRFRQILDLPR